MEESITQFRIGDFKKGTQFGITDYEQLISSDDIFRPSLRDFHVIFWIKRGRGSYFLDFKEYEFSPGTAILLPRDQLNWFKPFDRERTEICSVSFTPEFIYQADRDIRHLFAFSSKALRKNPGNILPLSSLERERWERLFVEMFAIYNGKNPSRINERLFYHYLSILLIRCEELLEKDETRSEILSGQNKLILEFDALLEQSFKDEINVGYYADNLGLSVKSLQKLTKEYYRQSPKALIHERRILEIKRLLKGTSKSGKAIALELNFLEPTNMFKYFRKHVGMSPGEFRSETG